LKIFYKQELFTIILEIMENSMENQYLKDYYSNYDEDGRLERRHGTVEFLTTMRYIEKYLKPGDRILEIGAATGRYSHALARKGYKVDAVELLDHHIELFKKNTQPEEEITIVQGDAMDLSGFSDDTYDITLILGPLYHLYNQEDKRKAIKEAIRVTKTGGIIFAAYVISDCCILDEGFKRGHLNIAEYITKGLIDENTFATTSRPEELFELVRKEDIDDLMSVFPVTRLHYVASDGYAYCMREAVSEMDENTFNLYLKYHFATCERADMAGMTSHCLDIFQKR
jgi:ubiquinone/menaquinone biosynthesis C-methylase UbiE